jgi:drug/metabolite transporter (DMT)-like permease
VLGIALGLAASLSWGVSDFLGGLQSRRMSVLSVLVVSQPAGLVAALLVALGFGATPLEADEAAYSVAAGIAAVLALAAFYRAMALGSVSVVATIGALGVVVPIAFGVAQGEDPAAIQAAGAAAAIAGVVLVSREPDAEWRSAGRASVGLAGLAAVGFGAAFVLLDRASGPEPAWTIVCARAGSAVLILAAALYARPAPAPSRSIPLLALIGLLDTAAISLFALATNHGLLSLVSVAGSLFSAVTVVLAWIFLGERLRGAQRIGVVLALGGVAAIAAGA